MTVLRLRDPSRRPAEWTGHLTSNQFAVFLNDVKTHATLDVNGYPPAKNAPLVCYVFDSMSEVEAFCIEKCGRIEHLLCEVYDRRGKILPLRVFTHPKHAHRVPNRKSARRMIAIAWLLIAVTPLFFWIDYRRDGTLIVPTVVGFASFVAGLRLLFWGHSEMSQAIELEQRA